MPHCASWLRAAAENISGMGNKKHGNGKWLAFQKRPHHHHNNIATECLSCCRPLLHVPRVMCYDRALLRYSYILFFAGSYRKNFSGLAGPFRCPPYAHMPTANLYSDAAAKARAHLNLCCAKARTPKTLCSLCAYLHCLRAKLDLSPGKDRIPCTSVA